MNDSVLILYLEDDPLDVELVRDKLKQAGIDFNNLPDEEPDHIKERR